MAVTVTDRRTIQTEADSITGWTGASAADTTQFAEATASVGAQFNIETNQLYHTGTSRNLGTSPGTLVYVYTWNSAFKLGWETGAHTLMLGDGTDRIGFEMSGNDKEAFSHSDGPVVWQNFVLDTGQASTMNSAGNAIAYAGSFAGLDFTAITQFGAGFDTQSKALGGGYNCFVDIIRFGNDGIRVTGGGSGTEGNLLEVAIEDRSTANQKAHGVLRELTTNTYGIQSPVTFGDSGTATNSYFEDENVSLTYEDRDIGNDKYYLNVEGHASATNSFVLSNSSIASAGPFVTIDMSNANINTLTLTGVTFSQLGNDITFASTGATGHDVSNCTFRGVGDIDVGAVSFPSNTIADSGQITIDADLDATNMTVSGYEGTADTGALIYNTSTDTDGVIDGSSFTKGTASTHAIEFGATIGGTITLRNIDFSGYNASDSQTDSTLLVRNTQSSPPMTINLVGCTGNISVKTLGKPVNLVIDPVTTTIKVVDVTTALPLQNARVIVEASDGTGYLPFEDSVTIIQAGGIATVTHTAHGLANSDKVNISGATDNNYTGVKEITVTGTNTYTYSIANNPTSPATGTIISTGVVLEGLTDVNGEISDTRSYSLDQPIVGHARKSSAAPYYKTGPFTGTVDAATGYSQTVGLIPD